MGVPYFLGGGIKFKLFHEYGHAAHYNGLNDDGYWLDNIAHIGGI